MTNDEEANKKIIKRDGYGNSMTSYFLKKNDAIEEYRERIKNCIKKLNKNKEFIQKEYEEKLKENDKEISDYYNLLKNPKIRF